MRTILLLTMICTAISSASAADEARSLFNGRDLTGWETYLGVPEVPTLPFDLFGNWPAPIGRGVDPRGVFSVVEEDGQPAIRISGEIWGGLIHRDEFANYHLTLEFKWGEQRFAPREDASRNTGLLYHSVGPDGAFWSYWMRSVEFEIMEGRTGDLTSVDGVEGRSTTEWAKSVGYPWNRFHPEGEAVEIGGAVFRIAASEDFERPPGQWNRLELFVVEDTALHRVNGRDVMKVSRLKHEVGEELLPLTRGGIQLQSEGAEVFFRNLVLRPIESLPTAVSGRPRIGDEDR